MNLLVHCDKHNIFNLPSSVTFGYKASKKSFAICFHDLFLGLSCLQPLPVSLWARLNTQFTVFFLKTDREKFQIEKIKTYFEHDSTCLSKKILPLFFFLSCCCRAMLSFHSKLGGL